MRCIAAVKRCQIAKNEPFRVDLAFWRWSTKIQWDQRALRILSTGRIRWRRGRSLALRTPRQPRGDMEMSTRSPRQEKVDGNGFPPWSMASDSFGLNVKGINRCDACKQLLLVKLCISGCIYLQTFCRDMRREFAAAARLNPLCRTCPAPVIEGQAHREAVGPKILPTYPLEGCPLLREYLIVEGGRKRQIL